MPVVVLIRVVAVMCEIRHYYFPNDFSNRRFSENEQMFPFVGCKAGGDGKTGGGGLALGRSSLCNPTIMSYDTSAHHTCYDVGLCLQRGLKKSLLRSYRSIRRCFYLATTAKGAPQTLYKST